MNDYQKELQTLRPDDEIQTYSKPEWARGYSFIETAGHGYLVVPKSDGWVAVARANCQYGYDGKLAFYLEEDCEATAFLKTIS